MNIVWYGQSCFKITTQRQKTKEKVALMIDPFSEKIGLKIPKTEADVFLFTHNHHDHRNEEFVKKDSFVISCPGEYELRDIFIQGIHSFHDDVKGSDRGINTIYTIETEDVRLCHLGDFGENELSNKQLKEIGEVDVLMIPVGGVYTIGAKGATKVISQIEPRIIIPMHYQLEGLKLGETLEDVESFLKAIGEKGAEKLEKLSLQKKDLPSSEMKVFPLAPQSKKV